MLRFVSGYLVVAVTLVLAPPVGAQALLHTLSSPNPEFAGRFGEAVAGVLDVDGDGRDDLLVGARGEAVGDDDAGRAYVFSGATGALLHTLASPDPEVRGAFGYAVAGVPDADGDGRGDLLVGAKDEALSAGRAYVFSGATGTLLHTLTSPNGQTSGYFGYAVAGVEDADGDGRGDLLVGAYRESPGSSPDLAGRAYVFSGATGALLDTLTSPEERFGGFFGWAVSGASDVDGDGRGDLLIGAPGDGPFLSDEGRVYVFSGATGDLLRTLVSPNAQRAGFFGYSVSGAPDLDGDGRGDFLVGTIYEDPEPSPGDAGRAYAFSSASGTLLHDLASPNEERDGAFGCAVAGVPDVNGDGRAEILVGARNEDPGNSPTNAGRSYLFDGATGTLLYELTSPQQGERGQFGFGVASVGDADGDGYGDFLIGAPVEGDMGRAYLGSGRLMGTAVENETPLTLALHPSHPNPTPSRAALPFVLAASSNVRLAVYDMLGREVAVLVDGEREAGRHEVPLDAERLPAGSYLVRLEADGRAASRRVTVVR